MPAPPVTDGGLPSATAVVDLSHTNGKDLAQLAFVRAVAEKDLRHLQTRRLRRRPGPDQLPPGHVLVVSVVDEDQAVGTVARVDDAVVYLEGWRQGGDLIVAAADPQRAAAVASAIVERGRTSPGPDVVPVEFVDHQLGSRHLDVDVRPWARQRHLYPAAVAASLDRLTSLEAPEDPDGPRLLLWHGRPGTGKTTAVRALFDAWREWAHPVVVSDPETLLTNPRYLRRVILDADTEEEWRLVVMEDAEALLRARAGGPLVGKLLNLADGLLGAGLRCLFLLTTNQSLDQVHPALLRPGRCLSLLEFAPLSAAEAARLRGGPVPGPMTLAEVLGSHVDVVAEPVADGRYL